MKPTIILAIVLVLLVVIVLFKEYQKAEVTETATEGRYDLYSQLIGIQQSRIQLQIAETAKATNAADWLDAIGDVANAVSDVAGA